MPDPFVGATCIAIDGAMVWSEEDLFAHFAREFSFPAYFGWNWDAFHDCLTEMRWPDDTDLVVAIEHSDLLWGRCPDALARLIAAWLDTATWWRREGRRICLVFRDSADSTGCLAGRPTDAGTERDPRTRNDR